DGTNPETLVEINRLKKENKWLQEQLKQFNQLNELRVSLTASGGGLSSNERIYLEDSQALAVVKVAASQFDVAMEECLHIYKKVMQELQEDWENGLQLIQRHTPELSYAEMREAMDQVQ
ncbi:triacylglycerol lipase, partial [Clostridium perfringens]